MLAWSDYAQQAVPLPAAIGAALFKLAHYQESYRQAPAIYQEYVEGNRHIRLNCFGAKSYAAEIVTEAVDWRPNLKVPISAWDVPQELHDRVRRVLDSLNLEMGIVDLKENAHGDMVWLEVNPQGQFIFLDALTRLDLAFRFAEYLITLANER